MTAARDSMVGQIDDRLQQILRVPITHLGEPQTAKVYVENSEPTTLTLDATTQEVEVAIPAVDRDTEVTVRVEVGDETKAVVRALADPRRADAIPVRWLL